MVKLTETRAKEFEKKMLEQILKTAASKSLIYLQFFIGRVINVESLSIYETAQQLKTEKDSVISRIELREGSDLVGSIYMIFPFKIVHRLAEGMYADLIPEILEKHVLDMAEEMTNIISAPLSEAVTFFRHTTVIPSVARIISYDEFKSLPLAEDLVLELKTGGNMCGEIYFVLDEETVKKLRRTLRMKARG
ncbi:hypothetical protein C5S36_00470 [Candidatus Methanophagaceae archaeon]|nr:hypothetical protein C5S36_00470 [Methanophagales archaeon]